jgi:hypothetical protein
MDRSDKPALGRRSRTSGSDRRCSRGGALFHRAISVSKAGDRTPLYSVDRRMIRFGNIKFEDVEHALSLFSWTNSYYTYEPNL